MLELCVKLVVRLVSLFYSQPKLFAFNADTLLKLILNRENETFSLLLKKLSKS